MKITSKIQTRISAQKWLEILKMVPNLESLELEIENLTITNSRNCEMLQNLQKLTLKLQYCNVGTFLDYIRQNSLQSLTVTSHWIDFDDFIARQLKIKDLTVSESNFNQPFDNYQLDSFTLIFSWIDSAYDAKSDLLMQLIRSHPDIKSVSALYEDQTKNHLPYPLRNDVIKALCHLPSLEKLMIADNSLIDDSDLVQCSAKEVVINNGNIFHKVLKMRNIQTLTVCCRKKFGINKGMSETLQHLRVENNSDCNLNNVLSTLPRLESLEWGIFTEKSTSRTTASYKADDTVYPHLKKLKLNNFKFNQNLKLFEALPNLESLHLEACNISYCNTALLNEMSSMPKLKNLIITLKMTNIFLAGKPLIAFKKLCKRLGKFQITFINVPKPQYLTFVNQLSIEFPTDDIIHPSKKKFALYETGFTLVRS